MLCSVQTTPDACAMMQPGARQPSLVGHPQYRPGNGTPFRAAFRPAQSSSCATRSGLRRRRSPGGCRRKVRSALLRAPQWRCQQSTRIPDALRTDDFRSLQDLSQRRPGALRRLADDPDRHVRAARAQRRRQVDADAHARHAAGGRRGQRAPRRHRRAARQGRRAPHARLSAAGLRRLSEGVGRGDARPPRAAQGPRDRRERARRRRDAAASRPTSTTCARRRSAASPAACASASASRRRCSAIRGSSSSTSRPRASIPRSACASTTCSPRSART